MIILFLINVSQSISEIINFVNNIFINISIFDIKEKVLSSEVIVYENNIVKKSLINLIKEFYIL